MVLNDANQLLMIFRNSKWDLPKGKVEKNELSEDAAIREVEEETGVRNLTIEKNLPNTYHMYSLKEKYYLKKTFWYEMKTTDKSNLKPQFDEGILEVEWKNKEQAILAMQNTYDSLKQNLELILPKIVQ